MIAILRQYLLTLVVLGVGLIFGWPYAITFGGVAAALLIDFFGTGRSTDLALYRKGLKFDARAPRRLGSGQAIRLHLVAAVVSALIALAPRAFGADTAGQQIAGVIALLTGGSIASYSGLQIFLLSSASPRDLLTRLDFMPYYLWHLNALAARTRRKTGAIIWIALSSVFGLLPFAAIIVSLHETAVNIPLVLATLTLAVFFQVGFVTLAKALFLLRWIDAEEK